MDVVMPNPALADAARSFDSSRAESCCLPCAALMRLYSRTTSSFHLFKLNTRSSGCRENNPSWRWQVEEPTRSHKPGTIRGRCEHRVSPVSPHASQLPKILLEIVVAASCEHVKNYLPGPADVNLHKFIHQPYSRRTAA